MLFSFDLPTIFSRKVRQSQVLTVFYMSTQIDESEAVKAVLRMWQMGEQLHTRPRAAEELGRECARDSVYDPACLSRLQREIFERGVALTGLSGGNWFQSGDRGSRNPGRASRDADA